MYIAGLSAQSVGKQSPKNVPDKSIGNRPVVAKLVAEEQNASAALGPAPLPRLRGERPARWSHRDLSNGRLNLRPHRLCRSRLRLPW